MQTRQRECNRSGPIEIIDWLNTANPFKQDTDRQHFIDGLILAGLNHSPKQNKGFYEDAASMINQLADNVFRKEADLWHMTFQGNTIQMSEVKGFVDLSRMMAKPGIEIHCTEFTDHPSNMSEQDAVMDKKARRSYERRIRDLYEEIRLAEEMNDLGRSEKLNS